MQSYPEDLSSHLPCTSWEDVACTLHSCRLLMGFVCSITLLFCSFSLDLRWAMWLECIWLRTMKCQTWLKNLKRLKRIWKPRRSPLVPDACLALHSGPTSSVLGVLSPSQPHPKLCSSSVSPCALPQLQHGPEVEITLGFQHLLFSRIFHPAASES